MDKLIKALVKAKGEFGPIKKNKKGMHNAMYATMDEVLSCTEPALLKHGLVVTQPLVFNEGHTCIQTTILHESGEQLSSSYPLNLTPNNQQNGSAITYGRRYSYCALLGITADEDDDGDSTVGHTASNQAGGGVVVTGDPGEFVAPVGAAAVKGKKLKDIPHAQLTGAYEYFKALPNLKGQAALFVAQVDKYLASK
jgi:hypothetical protein